MLPIASAVASNAKGAKGGGSHRPWENSPMTATRRDPLAGRSGSSSALTGKQGSFAGRRVANAARDVESRKAEPVDKASDGGGSKPQTPKSPSQLGSASNGQQAQPAQPSSLLRDALSPRRGSVASMSSAQLGAGRDGSVPRQPSILAPSRSIRAPAMALSILEWKSVSNMQRLQVIDDVACFCAVVAIVLTIVDNECYTQKGAMNNGLRGVISGLCGAIILLLYKAYQLELQALKISNIMPKEETMWSSGLYRPFLLEAFVCSWHTPPGVRWSMEARDTSGKVIYYNEAMLALTVFAKLYLLFRSLRDHHSVAKGGGRFLCTMNATEPSVFFVLKALLEKNPFSVLGGILLANLVVGSYALMVCEQAASPSYMFSDAQWNLYIALTTVGFGDIYPYTYPGRTVIAVSVFVGLCSTALLITVVQENLRLTKPQTRVLETLSTSAFQREYRNAAASCMQRLWRLHKQLKEQGQKKGHNPAPAAAPAAQPSPPHRRGSSAVPSIRAALGIPQQLPFDRRALRHAVMDFKLVRKRWREYQEARSHLMGEDPSEVPARLADLEGLVQHVADQVADQRETLSAMQEALAALLKGGAGGRSPRALLPPVGEEGEGEEGGEEAGKAERPKRRPAHLVAAPPTPSTPSTTLPSPLTPADPPPTPAPQVHTTPLHAGHGEEPELPPIRVPNGGGADLPGAMLV